MTGEQHVIVQQPCSTSVNTHTHTQNLYTIYTNAGKDFGERGVWERVYACLNTCRATSEVSKGEWLLNLKKTLAAGTAAFPAC